MNYKIILLIFTTFILASCNQDNQNKNLIKFSPEQKYKNTGFTLVYNNKLRKEKKISKKIDNRALICLLYTSPSPRDVEESRMPSSA